MSQSNRIVVGLTGPFGAGCTEIATDLQKRKGFRTYSLSNAMRDLAPQLFHDVDLERLHSQKDRSYQQDIGDRIRRQKIDAMPEHVFKNITQDEKRDKSLASLGIVIDGIRNPSEMTYFRNIYAHFFVLAVFADFQTRWAREQEVYDNPKTFRRDDDRDSGQFEPSWGQKVQLCVDRSDILISNDEQFTASEPRIEQQFQKKLDYYIDLMREPGSAKPNHWEFNMAQVYSASLMSTCCKRKVGAVVVREEEAQEHSRSYMIASGYNEAPLGIASCLVRGGGSSNEYCYKDQKIKDVLTEQYSFCPKCGADIEFPADFDLPVKCPNTKCPARLGTDFIPGRMLDICIAAHAEESAMLQASKFGGTEIEGSILYTTTFPCSICAKMLVYSGIRRVIFAEPYPQEEAINALGEAGIKAFLFQGVKGRAYHRLFELPPNG